MISGFRTSLVASHISAACSFAVFRLVWDIIFWEGDCFPWNISIDLGCCCFGLLCSPFLCSTGLTVFVSNARGDTLLTGDIPGNSGFIRKLKAALVLPVTALPELCALLQPMLEQVSIILWTFCVVSLTTKCSQSPLSSILSRACYIRNTLMLIRDSSLGTDL